MGTDFSARNISEQVELNCSLSDKKVIYFYTHAMLFYQLGYLKMRAYICGLNENKSFTQVSRDKFAIDMRKYTDVWHLFL